MLSKIKFAASAIIWTYVTIQSVRGFHGLARDFVDNVEREMRLTTVK